jgi:hypothetical protein
MSVPALQTHVAPAVTKGSGFVNARSFVERAGTKDWSAVLEQLAPDDRAALASIVSIGWYPIGLQARLFRAIDQVLGSGDLTLGVALGRFSAESDFKTVYRIFLRLFRTSFAIEKLMELWPRYHNTGTWTIEEKSARHVVGRLVDWAGRMDPILCSATMGYIGRSLELAGGKRVVVEHPTCAGAGDAACVFRATWDAVVTTP